MDYIQKALEKSCQIFLEKLPYEKIDQYILIIPSQQKLLLIKNSIVLQEYMVSTSKYGLGNKNESFQTPIGIHKISKKIGDSCPIFTVFKGRIPLGDNLTLSELEKPINEKYRKKHLKGCEDVITSRIMWLEGIEKGVNKGGNVDTYSRYIYIHGTAHEKLIGKEASHGCIRMRNDNIIELFEKVKQDMHVLILNN
jgi:hypothetical protein